MSDRKIQVAAFTWHRIPWNRNCDVCVHFVAAPAAQQEQSAMIMAVWNHFNEDHGIMLTGDHRLVN